MSDFTYETTAREGVYETYEWDNNWIDHANDNDTKRIFYIGDSISCATRKSIKDILKSQVMVDGFGTSRSLDNPFFKKALSDYCAWSPKKHIILFNNGLHGWHLEDETDYCKLFDSMLDFLTENFKASDIYVLLTTLATDGTEPRIIVRNKIAEDLAKKHGLKVIDLFTVSKENAELLSYDKVHFTPEGYKKLAEKVVEDIKESL